MACARTLGKGEGVKKLEECFNKVALHTSGRAYSCGGFCNGILWMLGVWVVGRLGIRGERRWAKVAVLVGVPQVGTWLVSKGEGKEKLERRFRSVGLGNGWDVDVRCSYNGFFVNIWCVARGWA